MPNRLMLCAGITRRDGWKTLDVAGGDYTAKIPPLPKEVMDVPWDEIELIHGITSFYPWEAAELLQQIWKCLKDAGILVLEQPDFSVAKNRVDWLFGDPGPMNPDHMNKWAYTPETLSYTLSRAGFNHISYQPARYHVTWRDFRIEAVK